MTLKLCLISIDPKRRARPGRMTDHFYELGCEMTGWHITSSLREARMVADAHGAHEAAKMLHTASETGILKPGKHTFSGENLIILVDQ